MVAEPLEQSVRLLGPCLREDQHDLVSAVPKGDVSRAQHAAHAVTEGGQDVVADLMTFRIVDRFKAIKVYQDHSVPDVGPVEDVNQLAAAGQAGQGIRRCRCGAGPSRGPRRTPFCVRCRAR